MSKKVIITGGGIIGLSCAYYLQQEGHQVTVIDKGNFNQGASNVNAGYITPSHFIPLPSPGIISKGLKWMLNPTSPFYIKPRLDLDFIKWALKFKSFTTTTHAEQAIKPILDINLLSRALYEELRTTSTFDFHYEQKGLLMVYKTKKTEEEELKIGERAQKEGLDIEVLSWDALKKVEPLAPLDARGGILYHSDAHMTPTNFMSQLLSYLKSKGVQIKSQETVLDMEVKHHKIQSVQTNKANYQTDEVVLASGAWTQKMARELGLNIWLQAGKGYSINIKRSTDISMPTILCESKIAVTPMQGFTRLAGTMEIGGINHKINKARVQAIANSASSYYQKLDILPEEIEAAQCGLRPVSPDGLPYIGKPSQFKNLCIATGHAMMGWSLGPATGKLISELISKQPLSMDISAFDPNRFL